MSVCSGMVGVMRDISRLTTSIGTDEYDRVVRVGVSDGSRALGVWVRGYPDVSADVVNDKDAVREAVREAIADHAMGRREAGTTSPQ
jgi:hypothetical protein